MWILGLSPRLAGTFSAQNAGSHIAKTSSDTFEVRLHYSFLLAA